ncbi:MAG: hypothetical protein K2L05_08860 [Muribaculaceae bacterium]|nr:hypothetical protein [Muribaculaceae bacterium]
MEEKNLTEKESMELIATMIANTKKGLMRGEGNLMLFWGYFCLIFLIVENICSTLYLMRHNFDMNWDFVMYSRNIWWVIPLVGIPYTLMARRRRAAGRMVMTYTDKISNALWNYVLWLAVATVIVGAVFFLSGMGVWNVMLLFTFFVIGMAISFQGIIINEKPMIFGGGFSVICGGFIVIGLIFGNHSFMLYAKQLFLVSFIVMLIIPGHILNYKAKKA